MSVKKETKKRYESPEQFYAAVNAYFSESEEKGIFPDTAGLRVHLRVTKEEMAEYIDPKKTKEAKTYERILADVKDRQESWLTRKMVSDPKAANGCMNALKQLDYGGWSSTGKENKDQSIRIDFSGVGGMEAFKE